ncbi:MAG: hypothetical protein QOI34_648, partial [Verrucomicrobiota bacterium]
ITSSASDMFSRGAAQNGNSLLRGTSGKRGTSSSQEHDNEQPIKLLERELRGLRQDLRRAVRAYVARMEIGLAQSAAVIASYGTNGSLPRERMREIRDLTIMLRNRNLSPEKRRGSDLREIDSLISELRLATHSGDNRDKGH